VNGEKGDLRGKRFSGEGKAVAGERGGTVAEYVDSIGTHGPL